MQNILVASTDCSPGQFFANASASSAFLFSLVRFSFSLCWNKDAISQARGQKRNEHRSQNRSKHPKKPRKISFKKKTFIIISKIPTNTDYITLSVSLFR